MSKHELLVPAGDIKSLEQAVANGADAVYVGCKNFGARKYAQNFTNEELVKAIKYCHLYGVKIYATMNTLIKDNEVEEFLKQIEFLHRNGIDAVLIQDFGMICLVRRKYPNLEVHASTQTNTSSKETAELFYHLGVKRVVFAREMSLEEIEEIKVPIEKEVFIHGALCICYSGCCLMSSMLGNRSGNRGECTGCCRLPYTLMKNSQVSSPEHYLLSTKELNTSTRFKKLLNSSIKSFKIEGRMKSPEYVGFITRLYRKLIDSPDTVDLNIENNKLKTIFNREFTLGHLFSSTPNQLMNINSPNHLGLEIGKVISVTNKKIKIKLIRPLNQQDAIRFLNSNKGFVVNYLYDENGKLTNQATDICYVDNKVGLEREDIVCKTQDYNLLTELKQIPQRKIPITINVIAKLNSPLQLEIADGIDCIKIQGNMIEASKTSPTTKDRIKKQVEKLGDSPYFSTTTTVIADENIFISIKEINELRRKLIEKLTSIRMNRKTKVVVNDVFFPQVNTFPVTTLSATVCNETQLQTCNSLNISRIYIKDEKLYEKYKGKSNIYYKLPRCQLHPTSLLKAKNLVSEYFDFSKTHNCIGDYGLNVTNIYSAYYLYQQGLSTVTLSVELTEEEIINFIDNYLKKFNAYPNIEVVVYGKIENMIIKDNILNIVKNDYQYYLQDKKKRKFPIYYDGNNTHILNYDNKILINHERLKKHASIRFDFYDEDEKTIYDIVNKYQ